MDTKSKYTVGDRAKDYSIKAISFVFGSLHFAARLTADASRECEAQLIHQIDKGCEIDIIRSRRDHQYENKMEDLRARIEETRRVMDETYERLAHKMKPEDQMIANIILANADIAPDPPQG